MDRKKGNVDLGNIMHGLSDQSLVPDEAVFVNMPHFPSVSEGKGISMLLCSSLKRWELAAPDRVDCYVDGVYIKEGYTYRYFDYRQVFSEQKDHGPIMVSVQLAYSDTVRISMHRGFGRALEDTEMIACHEPFDQKVSITDSRDTLVISNGRLSVVIDKDPWHLRIEKDGKPLMSEFGKDCHSFMPYEVCPAGFLFDSDGESYACTSFSFGPYENIYGSGENFSGLNRRGRAFTLWNTNALGVNTNRAYKNIPFFHSSNGYAVMINSSHKIHADYGCKLSKAIELMVGGEALEYFVFAGDSFQDRLRAYYRLTGMPAIPPAWSFGLWIGKISYRSEEEVRTVAKKFRDEDIPCDVIHVDTDWFEENWVCDWKFAKDRFPDEKKMIDDLHKAGYRLSLWQLPYVERGNISTEVYDEGVSKGYFASLENGDMMFPHGLIDMSNPEAVEWYKDKLLRPLLEEGVDVIKVDFGESAPEFFRYAGASSEEMHNLYALLYNKAVYEVTKEVKGSEAMIWARSAWAGSQRYPVHWGGDAGTDFGSLATSLRSCLSLSLSGLPFWSSDVGGFWFDSDPELYVRWSQFGMFCSHARLHGFYTREPWDFGKEAEDIFRSYVKLRYSLMPYILNQARAVADGSLMHRAMIYSYPDDPNTENIETEYMFGSEILVSPVLERGGRARTYLPAGLWTNLVSGEKVEGGRWIDRVYALDEFPVFAAPNAIIARGPSMNYVGEISNPDLTLDIYPDRTGERSIRLSDPAVSCTLSSSPEAVTIALDGDYAGKLYIEIHDADIVSVMAGDEEAAVVKTGSGIRFEAVKGKAAYVCRRA